jgi:RNA polymerase-interacting CarD/CdnL/TRCF family regulator
MHDHDGKTLIQMMEDGGHLLAEYDQKINSGKLYDLTEVVRDLNKKTDIIAEQSYSERQLFEKAYERLKSEFEIVIGDKAKLKIDKALKRDSTPETIIEK